MKDPGKELINELLDWLRSEFGNYINSDIPSVGFWSPYKHPPEYFIKRGITWYWGLGSYQDKRSHRETFSLKIYILHKSDAARFKLVWGSKLCLKH